MVTVCEFGDFLIAGCYDLWGVFGYLFSFRFPALCWVFGFGVVSVCLVGLLIVLLRVVLYIVVVWVFIVWWFICCLFLNDFVFSSVVSWLFVIVLIRWWFWVDAFDLGFGLIVV